MDFPIAVYFPVMDLPKATLLVSGGYYSGQGLNIDKDSLKTNKVILTEEKEKILSLVSSEEIAPFQNVLVVEPTTSQVLEEDSIGEIIVSGPNIAQGYWNNPLTTESTFPIRDGERFLYTGDLGFIHKNELFITGRKKDLIILNGKNIYPQDIEHYVEEASDLIRQGRVAAFDVPHEERELLAILAEVRGQISILKHLLKAYVRQFLQS